MGKGDARKRKSAKVSLGDVAQQAGVSKTAASFALQNHPGVSPETRARIRRVARKLGYAPDARVASWMATVQRARSKDPLPIAWLNTNSEKNAFRKWEFLSPYLEGAQESAAQLGYRIEEFWANDPGMPLPRLSQILYQRGIEGVIISHPARRLRLDWDHLAGISLEGTLLVPRLHRVMTDHYSNLIDTLNVIRRAGYRRIGVCLEEAVDRCSAHTCRAATQYFQSRLPKGEQIAPLFYAGGSLSDQKRGEAQAMAWLKLQRPDVVVGLNGHLVKWVRAAGYRVPEEVGVVNIATDDDVPRWAGICSHRREIGAAAVKLVISLMQNRQFGVPKIAMQTLIRGEWTPGDTLLLPKP